MNFLQILLLSFSACVQFKSSLLEVLYLIYQMSVGRGLNELQETLMTGLEFIEWSPF